MSICPLFLSKLLLLLLFSPKHFFFHITQLLYFLLLRHVGRVMHVGLDEHRLKRPVTGNGAKKREFKEIVCLRFLCPNFLSVALFSSNLLHNLKIPQAR